MPRSSGRAIERGLARGRNQRGLPQRGSPGESHGDEQIGPSMSTEPGWMGVSREDPLLLGEHSGRRPQNDPSMLLSFERPASAGSRGMRSKRAQPIDTTTDQRSRLSTVLENCTEATSAAIDKRRLNNGYHRALQGQLRKRRFARGAASVSDHVGPDHRQDSKGAWWMPWHQESKKDVNGCDKPRLGAE